MHRKLAESLKQRSEIAGDPHSGFDPSMHYSNTLSINIGVLRTSSRVPRPQDGICNMNCVVSFLTHLYHLSPKLKADTPYVGDTQEIAGDSISQS